VDETVDATRCGGRADCKQGEMCLTHELWSDLSVQIHQFLSKIDLASIIARGGMKPASGSAEGKNFEHSERAVGARLSAREL
jgi:Rrf2 family iron-sulfur cluster assembly transcriptional regulator